MQMELKHRCQWTKKKNWELLNSHKNQVIVHSSGGNIKSGPETETVNNLKSQDGRQERKKQRQQRAQQQKSARSGHKLTAKSKKNEEEEEEKEEESSESSEDSYADEEVKAISIVEDSKSKIYCRSCRCQDFSRDNKNKSHKLRTENKANANFYS